MNSRRLFISIILFFKALILLATHNRAGEITYKQIGELTYEINITTYTFSLSPADRDSLEVDWGDGTYSLAPRITKTALPDYYQLNIYRQVHVFPGPGVYQIVVQDPNRNLGVGNIPNSVNVVFAIKTTLQINPLTGFNNTPVLLNPPIDKAALYQTFIHNPSAYDPDGDSLSYALTTCLGADGIPIADYFLPPYDQSFTIDPVTGDLVWDAPIYTGIYNVAILIEEWRQGVRIGSIIRDMQIEVKESDNQAPQLDSLPPRCVVAGDTLKLQVSAWDPELRPLFLSATGGPFMFPAAENPATFTPFSNPNPGYSSGIFQWNTLCAHVRKQPYQVVFKAQDYNASPNLVDLKSMQITVIAPPIRQITPEPTNNSIQLSWAPSDCSSAAGYKIYRRVGLSGFVPDSCQTGVPSETGYALLATTQGYTNTTFPDNDGGQGLIQGLNYCYIITSFLSDGAESKASEEVCSFLVRGIPAITHVDILSTDPDTGRVYIDWAKPTELETGSAPGPYKYLIYRSPDLWGEALVLIDSLYLKGLDDTVYLDQNLNTRDHPWSYKIELINDQSENRFLIGSPQIASSVFLKITPSDNTLTLEFEQNTPWIDSAYTVFRRNNETGVYSELGQTQQATIEDAPLRNGTEYSYFTTAKGYYQEPGIASPLFNRSQVAAAIPLDTVPPCLPPLLVQTDCEAFFNLLSWSNPNLSCSDDAVGYRVYYSENFEAPFHLIATIDSAEVTHYSHSFADSSLTMAGCYAVTALDSLGNESHITTRVCTDACSYFTLPNVFTPNGDNLNDYLVSTWKFVVKVDMKIFNRWGVQVFHTENPEIQWDGRFEKNNQPVTDGVYYYVCDVYEHRLSGLEHRTLAGFVHVFTGAGKPNNP